MSDVVSEEGNDDNGDNDSHHHVGEKPEDLRLLCVLTEMMLNRWSRLVLIDYSILLHLCLTVSHTHEQCQLQESESDDH